MSIFEKTTVFSQENIRPGHVIVLSNQEGTYASGIILEITPLILNLMVYTLDQKIEDWDTSIFESMVPYKLEVEKVVSGEIKVKIIDPMSLRAMDT